MIFLRLAELFFWKPHRVRKSRYLRQEYGALPPGIYYDRRYRIHVAPAAIGEPGSVEWVCQALTAKNLIFHFMVNGQREHAHTFDAVLLRAYNQAEAFSIPRDYEKEYSAQELAWAASVAERGRMDRARESQCTQG